MCGWAKRGLREVEDVLSSVEFALLKAGWQRRCAWDAEQEAGVRRVQASPEIWVGESSLDSFRERLL